MPDNLRKEISYFNEKSREYRLEYDKETAEGYSFRVRREKVLAMIPSNSKVLDIASGPGVMIPGLLAKGCTVTCIDAAPEMIARVKDEFGDRPNLSALVADAYALPFDNGSFDAATAMGLIEYLDKESVFLKEAARVLKDGGILIITFPNFWSPWRVFNRTALFIKSLFIKKDANKNAVQHREYTLARAQELLKGNGFSIRDVLYYNFKLIPYPLDRNFPRLTVWQSGIFESFGRSPLRFLGTAFIVKTVKLKTVEKL